MFNFKQRKIDKKNKEQRRGVSLITAADPNHVISEQFRTIRTNIQFAIDAYHLKTLMFTSSGPWEGKSTIAANVATTMAHLDGVRVLMIDCDLRKPTVHKTFDIHSRKGLTTYLTDRDVDYMDVAQYVAEVNTYVIPAGPIPPNPAELLSSQRMSDLLEDVTAVFDLVIIDAPPLLPVTDAQIIASRTDASVFVLREGVASYQDIQKSKRLLESVDANVIGAIYNGADSQGMNAYYGYGYRDEDIDSEDLQS
ncbi:CpsD/CapB family tyrosine-protein kinase [Aerococcus urinae]